MDLRRHIRQRPQPRRSIEQKYAGVMAGLMNTSALAGGLLGSVLHGYIVERFSSDDVPFIPMAAILPCWRASILMARIYFVGALLWLKIDASEQLSAELSAGPMPALV